MARVLACAALAAALCACVPSETITQTIYDQNEESTVDRTQQLLKNSLDAEQQSEQLSRLETDSGKEDSDEVADLPVYGGDVAGQAAAQPVAAEEATQQKPEEEDDEDSGEGDDDPNSESTNAGNAVPSEGEGQDADENGKSPDNEGDNPEDTGKGKRNKNNTVKVYENQGEDPEIPTEITEVTAVGEAAVIVSMLGGSEDATPLVAADEEFVESKQVQKVLAKKGVSKVKALWENDGDEKGDLKSTKRIIKLGPQLCFVTEGDATFTEAQEQELLDENIIVYYLPNMTTAKKICSAVSIVGQILAEGGNEQAGKLAEQYIEFHDNLVSELRDANGGLAGSFNFNTGKKVSSDADEIYSLLISDWDESAVYTDANNGYLQSTQGAAVARVGYQASPLSYYMSVGGVINNAASGAWRSFKDYSTFVWQFSNTQASCYKSYWKSYNVKKITYMETELKSQGFVYALTCANESEGLGTESFPGVIVKTQKTASLLEKDAKRDNGIYHPYPLTTGSSSGTTGMSKVGYWSGSNLVSSSIGLTSTGANEGGSVLNDGTTCELFSIYVNPAGLFEDWTDGGVESVLEAAWVYQTFKDADYDTASQVKEFYSSFYDYDLSSGELEQIMAGEEK